MRHELHEGSQVTLTKEVDLRPLCTLPAGACGTITEIARDEAGYIFAVEILMSRPYKGLEIVFNYALLGREAVLDAVVLVPDEASPLDQRLVA